MKFLDGYDNVAKAFHWLMALMIISLLAVGIYMHDLPKEDEMRSTLYMAHKASGMIILFLFAARILWRLTHKPPSLDRYSEKVRKVANAVHISLYLFMFSIPLSGYLMSTFHGYPVNFFGLFKFPLIVGKNESMAEFFAEAHEYMAFALIAILVLHIAGAVKHRFEK